MLWGPPKKEGLLKAGVQKRVLPFPAFAQPSLRWICETKQEPQRLTSIFESK